MRSDGRIYNTSDSRSDLSAVKLETLASGNIGKFGESGSNRQTYTYQSKVTKQNKRPLKNLLLTK